MTTRRGILYVALLLTAIAFMGSLGHVYQTVNAHDGDAPHLLTVTIALMPEITVGLVTVKLLTEGPRQFIAWLVGSTALAFTVAANLSQRAAGDWGFVVAVWPAWTSVGAMLLVHTRAQLSKRERAAAEAEHRLQLEEDARRATTMQEETNRLAAAELEQRQRETALAQAQLAEAAAARKAGERQQRQQDRTERPGPAPADDAVDSLEPVVWEISQERQAAGLGRIARDTPKAGSPLGLIDELKQRGYPGVGNRRAGALLRKVYGDSEVRS